MTRTPDSLTGDIQIELVGKSGQISLGKRVRGVCVRDGDFLRLISLHPDHDSAYGTAGDPPAPGTW